MFHFKHQFVWITPLVIFLFVEYVYRFYSRSLRTESEAQNPSLIYLFCLLSIFLVLVTIFSFVKMKNIKEFFMFIITPALLIVSEFALVLFFESIWLIIIVPIIFNSFLGIFLENIYLRFYKAEKFQDYTFGNISGFLNIFIMFSFSTALYGFIRFLGFEVWVASLAVLSITILTTLQNIWMIHYHFIEKGLVYIYVIPLIILEIFWIMNFLPSSIYVNGFIIAVIYYICIGLAKNQLLGIADKNIFIRYLAIGCIAIAIVFMTAKWA